MKQQVLLITLVLSGILANAQIYDSAVRYRMINPSFIAAADTLIARAANPADTIEENESYILSRWKNFMSSRVCLDAPVGADMVAPMGVALSSYMTYFSSYCSGAGYTGNWSCLGPFSGNYGSTDDATHYYPGENMGRIIALWVDPDNDSIILAGADCGGLWKSNTNGYTWHNLTDGAGSSSVLGMPGVNCIAVDPLNNDIIYVSLVSDGDQNKKATSYSLGVAYTTDGGVHWQTDTDLSDYIGDGPAISIGKIAFAPGTEELYVLYKDKIIYKSSPSGSWTDVSPSSSYWWQDMEFSGVSGDPIVSTNAVAGTAYLYKRHSGSWTNLPMTLTGGHTIDNVPFFSLTSSDDAIMRVNSHSGGGASELLLVKTPISSFSPIVLNNNLPVNITTFQVSQANPDIIYAGYYGEYIDPASVLHYPATILQSVDQGATFWVYPGCGHPDGRCICVYSSTNTTNGINDKVFVGTDGGVREKRVGNSIFESITGNGLAITQFYGFGNTECDENIMVAGAQDDGGFAYVKTNPEPWNWIHDGDGYISKLMPQHREGFGEYNSNINPHVMYKIDFSGPTASTTDIGHPSDLALSNVARPQYIDASNTEYVGYSHIWRRNYGSSTWTNAFHSDPIDHGSYVTPLSATDFYIDEHNNDSVYVVYRYPSSDPTNDTFGRLYFSYQATHTSPGWTNITPLIDTANNINSIAVDPNNASRIWIAFGNINSDMVGTDPASMTKRVWHSEDAGGTWTEASKGLSALPVNKLLYRKGSNDEIYAGTDVGVFKWNPDLATWECFNNGLPTCIVMDMEMNYCAGKLRVATYGRGIWETTVLNTTLTPIPGTDITGTQTWNQNMWLESSVSVHSGATLTITGCTIHMPRNGVIAVEPGGHLIVDSSVLTNSCDRCWWKGIEARGTAWLPQTIINDGWVTIQRHSIIEHAVSGVRNSNADVVWSTDGGIIQANTSTFRNNVSDARFDAYDNWVWSGTTPTLHPNLSSFTFCTFLQDHNYKGHEPGLTPENMVNLHGVEGVRFMACQFLNRDTFAICRQVGQAIDAVNSDFFVVPGCATSGPLCMFPSIRSRFCGFTNAINVHGLYQPGLAPRIDKADFDSVSVGVNVATFNNVAVTRCNFRVGNGLSVADIASPVFTGCYQNIGILTQNSNQFTIDENSFTGVPHPLVVDWYNFGTVVSNSGGYTNTIYKSAFDSLSYGVFTIGVNNDNDLLAPLGKGLKLFCNSFANNTNDAYVNSNGYPLGTYGGIAKIQGTFVPGSGYLAAGNTYSLSTMNICNNGVNIDYYYHNLVSAEDPTLVCGSVLLSPAGNVWIHTTDLGNSCLTHFDVLYPPFGPGEAMPLTVAHHKDAFRGYKLAYTDSLTQYGSLIDFGNTDSLITIINASTDTTALYSILSGGSPYISEQALFDAGQRLKLPKYSMMRLLAQNPDDLRKNNCISFMQSAYSLATAEVDTLITEAQNTTARTWLEAAIASSLDGMAEQSNVLLTALKTPIDTNRTMTEDSTWSGICMDSTSVYFMTDSNVCYAYFDSVGVWSLNSGELWNLYDLTGYYNFKGDTLLANNNFISIGGLLPKGWQPDSAAYDTAAKLWSAIYNAEAAGRNIYHLTSAEVASLNAPSIYPFSYNTGTVMIYGLSSLYTGTGVLTPPACPLVVGSIGELGRPGKQELAPAKPGSGSNGRNFIAYPNPSSDLVTFSFNVPDAAGDICVLVTSIVGQSVGEFRSAGHTGTLEWNTRGLASGVYLYQARSDRGVISVGRVVVVK